MAEVSLVNVSKEFVDIKRGKVLAVNNADICIRDREFIVFVGPSGCGKTTCLRMVAGLEKQTSGDIFIGETLVNRMPPKARDIAMVFQDYALYPHMTVEENLSFALKNLGRPKAEIQQKVKEASALLGIDELLKRRPKELSGGQRQRVALGRAIVRSPKVFLFDEPLSNLDAKLRSQMRVELAQLHQRLQTTTIYVTHDQVEAMTLGQRIVIMNKGVIQQVDTPKNLYDHPANQFVAGFLGSPGMNFIPGELQPSGDGGLCFVMPEGRKLKVPSDRNKRYQAYQGKQVIFGIRPEDISAGPQKLADPNGEYSLRVPIRVAEHLGSEAQLYFDLGTQVVAKVDAGLTPSPDEVVELTFNMNKMHLFNPETEEAI